MNKKQLLAKFNKNKKFLEKIETAIDDQMAKKGPGWITALLLLENIHAVYELICLKKELDKTAQGGA